MARKLHIVVFLVHRVTFSRISFGRATRALRLVGMLHPGVMIIGSGISPRGYNDWQTIDLRIADMVGRHKLTGLFQTVDMGTVDKSCSAIVKIFAPRRGVEVAQPGLEGEGGSNSYCGQIWKLKSLGPNATRR